MPMTDVVAQPESAPPHWAALRNKKIRSKLLRHDRLKPSRLAEWWTTGGWADRTHKNYTSGPRPRSLSLPPGVGPPRSMTVYARSTTGARAAARRQDSVRREKGESGGPGSLSHGDRFAHPRRQTPLPRVGRRSLFFFGGGSSVSCLGGRGRAPYLDLYTYFRFGLILSGNVRTSHKTHTNVAVRSRAGLYENGLV